MFLVELGLGHRAGLLSPQEALEADCHMDTDTHGLMGPEGWCSKAGSVLLSFYLLGMGRKTSAYHWVSLWAFAPAHL